MIHTMDSEELASFFLTSHVKLLHDQQQQQQQNDVSKSFERDTQLGTGKMRTKKNQ